MLTIPLSYRTLSLEVSTVSHPVPRSPMHRFLSNGITYYFNSVLFISGIQSVLHSTRRFTHFPESWSPMPATFYLWLIVISLSYFFVPATAIVHTQSAYSIHRCLKTEFSGWSTVTGRPGERSRPMFRLLYPVRHDSPDFPQQVQAW